MTARTTLKTIAITLAALGAGVAPAAIAAPAANDVRVEIDTRYLATDWGVEKIYNVLSSKAQKACDSGASRSSVSRKFERDCMSDLLNDFIQSADHVKLTTYHASMTN